MTRPIDKYEASVMRLIETLARDKGMDRAEMLQLYAEGRQRVLDRLEEVKDAE